MKAIYTLFALILGTSVQAIAQNKNSFDSEAACKAAFHSGKFEYTITADTAANGDPLRADTCVKTQAKGDWVILHAGTKVVTGNTDLKKAPVYKDQTTTCRIGTAWAVNPNRELARGERFIEVYAPGKVVITTQRETPGSAKIVDRRCILPDEKFEVAVGGLMPWFKKCGQAFYPEGWGMSEFIIRGEPGKDGAPGKNGRDGTNGRDGYDGRDGKDGKGASFGKVAGISAIIAGIIAGTVAVLDHHGHTPKGPKTVTGGAFSISF